MPTLTPVMELRSDTVTSLRRMTYMEIRPSILQTTTESEDTNLLHTTNVVTLSCTEITGAHRAINIEQYSTYLKLLRVTAYVHIFIHNCRRPRDED
ncbi:hypothetical protein DPMN_077282 [Dreissena polymorpha]|uniref:Uncharacterized protein n=1 Tax=Dreissena polymorpha TaxID=45954 RepID=A0A9D4BPG7_DREPO|nr:hypothetical protein DPMN_077282 [Dreissena polymorpha]